MADAQQVGSLYYEIGAKDAKLKEQLAESDKAVKSFGERVSDAGDKIGSGLRTAAKGLAVVSVGLTAYAKSATDFTTDFVASSKKLAREIGVSVTEASRLTAAFRRMGLEADETQQMFGIFSKQIVASTTASTQNKLAFEKLQIQIKQTQQQINNTTVEIKKHGDKTGELSLKLRELNNTLSSQNDALKQNSDGFQKLGISTTDASGKQKDFNTLLFEVADKFQAMPDGIDKTTISMELFGRSGKDMIKVLNLGSAGIQELEKQADKLGLTLTPNTIDKVSKLVASQKLLKEQTDSLKIAVGTLTAPVLTKFNEKINDLLGGLIKTKGPLQDITTKVLAFGGPIAGVLSGMAAFLGNIGSMLPLLAEFGGYIAAALAVVVLLGGALYLIIRHFGGLQQTLEAMQPILNFFVNIWQFLKEVFLLLQPALMAVVNSIVQNLWPAIKQLWDSLVRLYDSLQPALMEVLKVLAILIGVTLLVGLKLFIDALNFSIKIFSFVVSAISDVIKWYANFYQWIGLIAARIIDVFKGVPGGIKAGLAGVVDVLVAPFKMAFNIIVGLWNKSIGALSFTAPSWVPALGGKTFSMPKLPTLDTGGLVTRPTIAALAMNNKPEVVLPLDKLGSMGNTYNIERVELSTADAVAKFFAIGDRNLHLEGMGGSPLGAYNG